MLHVWIPIQTPQECRGAGALDEHTRMPYMADENETGTECDDLTTNRRHFETDRHTAATMPQYNRHATSTNVTAEQLAEERADNIYSIVCTSQE